MIVVNLFAGPGAGKSTVAAGVFAELKRRGVNAELATEYAKDLCYEGTLREMSKYPIYFFAQQHHRIARLDGLVDVVVTDSPFILSLLYQGGSPELKDLAFAEHRRWQSMNIFLRRPAIYKTNGRSHSRDEAIRFDREIETMLVNSDIKYLAVSVTDRTAGFIAEWAADLLDQRDC